MAWSMSSRYRSEVENRTDRAGSTNAFLLTQLGTHAAFEFAKRLATIDLAPPHAGILRAIGASSGLSQQELAKLLSMQPSRLVVLVDELEEKALVERRDSRDDRRVYALQLTAKGRRALEGVTRISLEHDEAICRSLSDAERGQLAALLRRLADDQKLTPGVHPGYRRFGGGDK
jgi:DNA-binding MarR family transcriptional regulator